MPTVIIGPEVAKIITTATVGPAGPVGIGVAYVHTQDVASALWTIAHNLDVYPNVAVADTLDRQVEADITWVDANNITVAFAAATTGRAFLS